MPDLGECSRDANGLLTMWVGCPTCPEQRWTRLNKYDHRKVRPCGPCNRLSIKKRFQGGKALSSE